MYIIDGHNLIGKIGDLSLEDADDEMRLIERLQQFARLRRKTVEVYFDGAPIGRSGSRTFGTIKAHFVLAGGTADRAIAERLTRMGRQARNVILVSSDGQVQGSARSVLAAVQSSESFAEDLAAAVQEAQSKPSRESPVALDTWYRTFGVDPAEAEQPIEPPPVRPRKEPRPAKKRPHHGFQQKS